MYFEKLMKLQFILKIVKNHLHIIVIIFINNQIII